MGKKILPDLTTCCGVMTVKTGTYCIALFNQGAAIVGFVFYVSVIVIATNNISHNECPVTNSQLYYLITWASGILVTAAHIAMGFVLMRGLIKEESSYLRWYLVIGSGIVALNIVVIGCLVFFVHWSTTISTFGAIVMEAYFMLVIRSAYREMVMEEKAFMATRNDRSGGDNIMGEILDSNLPICLH